MGEALRCIDRAELKEMAESGSDCTVNCQFCDAAYVFTPADLNELLSESEDDGGGAEENK